MAKCQFRSDGNTDPMQLILLDTCNFKVTLARKWINTSSSAGLFVYLKTIKILSSAVYLSLQLNGVLFPNKLNSINDHQT